MAMAVVWSCGAMPSAHAQQPSIDELAAAARSPDQAQQIKAIRQLGTHGVAAVPTLAALLKSNSAVVRAYALHSLARIGPEAKGATENIVPLFADPDVIVRRQVIVALKAIRPGPKVSVPLFAKLMQDPDQGIRLRVMAAVADAKSAAVPALIEALKNPSVTYWACIILGDIGPDAAAAVPALEGLLGDRRPDVRREAVLALAAIGSKDSLAKIAPLLKDDDTRTAATFALGAAGKLSPEAESIVRQNVDSDDHLLSSISLWALARAEPKNLELTKTAATSLVARLKDKDPFAREASARALSTLPPNPQVGGPIFEQALANADDASRRYLLDAVAGLGAPVVPKLIDVLKYEPLRGEVASVLGRIGPAAAPATGALAKLVGDEDPNVSSEAAYALGAIGPDAKAAVPALVAALKQTDGPTAHAAAYALGRIGPSAAAAESALKEVLETRNDSLSLLCAWALVQMKGNSPQTVSMVLKQLKSGLNSSLPTSRKMAAETLGELGASAKGEIGALERATKDPDAEVRDAATKAIELIRS